MVGQPFLLKQAMDLTHWTHTSQNGVMAYKHTHYHMRLGTTGVVWNVHVQALMCTCGLIHICTVYAALAFIAAYTCEHASSDTVTVLKTAVMLHLHSNNP